MCEPCVQVFGQARSSAEYRYEIESCILCRKGHATVSVKPPTAGTRILCIDGGGVRGIVPLGYLSLLQDALGQACSVQDMFDVAFGTSSGSFIWQLHRV